MNIYSARTHDEGWRNRWYWEASWVRPGGTWGNVRLYSMTKDGGQRTLRRRLLREFETGCRR